MIGFNQQTSVISKGTASKIESGASSLDAANSITSEQIQDWIVTYLAKLLDISEDDIETAVSFDSYGLDSSAAIGLTGDLEDWLGQEIDPTVLYDYPTIEALVGYLERE